MELVWKRELRVFGNWWQIPMAAQKTDKQTNKKTHKSVTKLYPTLNHKSSKCFSNKYSEFSYCGFKMTQDAKSEFSLFLYLLTTVETSNLERQASESYNKVGTDFF